MRFQPFSVASVLAIVAVLHGEATVAGASRYVARLDSGLFIEGNTLSDWHSSDVIPKLDRQLLLNPDDPFRWLMDRSLPPPAVPAAYVEFVTGDRLPGTVIDFSAGDESPYARERPHFIVRHAGSSGTNLETSTRLLRVDARFVRRIVWRQRGAIHTEPRTVLFHAGNQLPFRSIRFGPGEASLLLETAVRRVPYSEMAELHLGPVDFWPIFLDELLELAPQLNRRLIQLECANGLVATTSLDRYRPRAVGDERDVNRWIHGIQPAWSLDLIWVPQGDVWMRRSWAVHAVPLTRVPALRQVHRSPLGGSGFPASINRNVAGGPLRAADREAGWGIGVHAFAELEYEFPSFASAFSSEFSIDASMDDGGCVLARVLNASAGNTDAGNTEMYRGPVLAGAQRVVTTGTLPLTGLAGARHRIVLQVDPVLTQRPPGADPLDIRDHANWLDPMVEFDAVALQQQLAARETRQLLGWRGWEVVLEPGAGWKWVNFFAAGPGNSGEYHPAVAVSGKSLVLTSTRPLDQRGHWLVIDAVRASSSDRRCRINLRIGDSPPLELELPPHDPSRLDLHPFVLPLAAAQINQAGPTKIEIRQLPDGVPVLWRSLNIVAQHPLVYRVFEDDAAPADRPPDSGTAIAQVDGQEKYSGQRSLKLAPGSSLRLPADRALAIRERPQLGEFRFLRMAVRQPGGGGLRVTVEQSPGARAAAYQAAANQAANPAARRLFPRGLGGDWSLVTRDLYSDFGNLDLKGLTIQVDGGHAWVDHVYVGRTQEDFELIESLSAIEPRPLD